MVCVHLLRYTDLNVTYSKNTRTGHGQVNLTFEDSVRGYYMAWYTRGLLLDWRRPMVVADSANADPGDHGHAPNVDRQYYYYKVSFVDDRCKPTDVVSGRTFGQPLGHADKFPGWAVALRHWEAHGQEPGHAPAARGLVRPLRARPAAARRGGSGHACLNRESGTLVLCVTCV